MACPVVQRAKADLPLLVYLFSVLPESGDTGVALLGVEPASRQKHAYSTNAIIDAQVRRNVESNAKRSRNLNSALPCPNLAGLNVVRTVMLSVQVPALLQHACIVVESVPACLVVINHPYFSTDGLVEPDAHRIAYPEVPRGIDQRGRVVWDAANAPIVARLGDFFGVVSASDCSIERALKLLFVLVLRHHGAKTLKLVFWKNSSLAGAQYLDKPLRVASLLLLNAPQQVCPSLWSAAQVKPASTVSQCRQQNCRKHAWADVLRLVSSNSVEVQPAKSLCILCTIQADRRTVVR